VTVAVQATADGVRFAVKAVPGASRSRVVGTLGDALKVQVAAPPEGGKANAALCELLAVAFAVPARAVAVVSGASSPRKVVAIAGVDVAAATATLQALGAN
jgi:uncharacterized protein (TIGR00251 family)